MGAMPCVSVANLLTVITDLHLVQKFVKCTKSYRLVYSLGLPMPITKLHPEEKWAWLWAYEKL